MNGGNYPIRTDLALESQESLKKNSSSWHGVRVFEEEMSGILISTVVIETENASKEMGRPRGSYITIEAPDMTEEDREGHRKVSEILAKMLRRLLPEDKDISVLVAGLGNREVTPDALGPGVIDKLFITRHIIKEFGKYAFWEEEVGKVSGIVPGVMAQTGMECVEILKGIVSETSPDYLITIDALAARSIRRLGRTIQLSNTGITPGSGIGNHRNAINEKSIGIPVISLGVPTVVDAATIVSDAMSALIEEMSLSDLQSLDEKERHELAKNILIPQLNGLFVTPKNIDESIRQLSFLIAEGINIALGA